MCDIWKRRDASELPAAELERHRASIVALGVRQVVLTGGEPLLHRELSAITSFFRDLQIRITLLTTGLLLYKKASLVAAGVDDIIVSIDGPQAIHDAIRHVPGAFQTIRRGIEAVRALQPSISISGRTTVQKQNHACLRDTVSAAHDLRLNSISFLPADLSSAAFNRPEEWSAGRKHEVALTAEELVVFEAEIEALISDYAQEIHSGFIVESAPKLRRLATRFREHLDQIAPTAPICNAPWVSAVMEIDGGLRPCFFHRPVASTAIRTLEEALNSDTALAFRSALDVASNATCQRCVCSLNYRVDK